MTQTLESPPSSTVIGLAPERVSVSRSDPIYNAHAYLTKVPITAIEPFILAFTNEGETVLDIFGGSGMTGVASMILGRNAEIRDISVLGQHIGSNYSNLVGRDALRQAADKAISAASAELSDPYRVPCEACGEAGTLSRTVWSYIYECRHCSSPVNYYEAFAATDGWKKSEMKCGSCQEPFVTRGSKRIGETPVFDTVSCPCRSKLTDQPHWDSPDPVKPEPGSFPDVAIGEDRQMFQSSALAKHGLFTTASFFSDRNLAVLSELRRQIDSEADTSIRSKLQFAFTAILTRASKRYQWNPKRPLNAANQNYYIAPVFYEWNVFDLFSRKVNAVSKSDEFIAARSGQAGIRDLGKVNYEVESADDLALADESIDYVFTDPPFGSNIFYSDMNLFQEAWLGEFTNHDREAVVDRSRKSSGSARTIDRYESLITSSLSEAHRVLKPGGWLSLVFSNSSGEIWALVQRSIRAAGFGLESIAILDKGQRSVKGLASGFENVVTVDLILSMQKDGGKIAAEIEDPPPDAMSAAIEEVLSTDELLTPSLVYVGVIREYLDRGWDVAGLDISEIGIELQARGYEVDSSKGTLSTVRGDHSAEKIPALKL